LFFTKDRLIIYPDNKAVFLFNYQLKSGRATTRNAIQLLRIMGYEPKIIEKAQEQAEIFLTEGIWKAT
jgi:DNA mismatch repair ATPase MutS